MTYSFKYKSGKSNATKYSLRKFKTRESACKVLMSKAGKTAIKRGKLRDVTIYKKR